MSRYSLFALIVSVFGILPFTYAMMWIEGIKSFMFPFPTHPLSFTITPLVVFFFLAKWCERNQKQPIGFMNKLGKYLKDTWLLYLAVPCSAPLYYYFFDFCSTPQSDCIDLFGIILGTTLMIAIVSYSVYILWSASVKVK